MPDHQTDRPTNHADAFLILRGLACLVIVIAHCQPPLAVLSSLPWGWLAAMPGGIAVRIFFTLSGYLVGKGFYLGRYGTRRSQLWRYARNRAARILPLYWAAVLIPAIFLAPSILLPSAENSWVLLRYLTFTYNHTLPEQFNSPLWSLSTEVQFYAIAPLLFGLVRDRLRTVRQVFIAIVMVAISWLVLRGVIVAVLLQIHGDRTGEFNLDFVRYVYTLLPANLDAFLCGLLLNPLLLNSIKSSQKSRLKLSTKNTKNTRVIDSIIQKFLETNRLKRLTITVIVGVFILCANWKISGSDYILSIGPTLSIIAVCLFIVAFERGDAYYGFRQNQPVSRLACQANPWRYWELLGVLSYGIYVWHYPIAIWLLPKFGELTNLTAFAQRTIAVFSLAMIAAIVSNLAIERPGAAWIKNLVRSSRSVQD
ncbi:MAG: acyltransferase [Coleofasciculaceae cyanobacterium RL_1_1]|nr:acyltransferase [Coleofasciculaceae cyanobacterium RL_1_1]